MPVSFEGIPYERYLFKPVENSETGGCHAYVSLPDESIPGPYPVALHFHGGGWTTGDVWHNFVGHTEYLLKRGIAVVSAEYRLAPHARMRHLREDWLDAYKWVKSDLKKVANRVDPTKVMVFGGSAGGTATLYVALDIEAAGLPPPQALYAVYPAINWDKMMARAPQEYDYAKFDEIAATLPEDKQALLKEMIDGPVCTAHDLKNEHTRPLTGRRVWYDMMMTHPFLVSCVMEHPAPPYPSQHDWYKHVTKKFPPTVLIKAMKDTLVDPEQTSDVYNKLRELGVDTKLIEAEGMLHGDLEMENDMKDHPPREAYFWKEVYPVALDWCIAKLGKPINVTLPVVEKEHVNGSAVVGSVAA